jgi:hypothetical protein
MRLDVPELDDEDSPSGTVLRNPEQVDDADEAGTPGNLGGDICEADLEHLRDDDRARTERVPVSHLHVWSLPQANRGSDLTAANAIAKRSNELHVLEGFAFQRYVAGGCPP